MQRSPEQTATVTDKAMPVSAEASGADGAQPRNLNERLAHLLGTPVSGLRRLSGGASRETWGFSVEEPTGTQHLVLRRDPPYLVGSGPTAGGMPLEARLFEAASAGGVPVPKLRCFGDADPDVLESGFLVMDLVEGETIARKILRDEPYAGARVALVRQLGAALARLHAIPIAKVAGLEELDRLARYRTVLDTLEYASPTFELAFRWLQEHRPSGHRRAIVHGDFRLGNVIVNETGLAAVLDWELAHIGDPMEDLGWLCVRAWRFGGTGVVAGLGALDELFAGYESEGGDPDAESVHWWMVAGTLIWGVMCALQASAHTSGANRSVELAAIGRRVAEQEHDLLELLGAPPADHGVLSSALAATSKLTPPSNGGAGSSVAEFSSEFGVPAVGGLLDAVRGFLEGDVFGATTGRVQFHTRVASNVLSIVEREILLGAAASAAFASCHQQFGVRSEAELAEAIRSGSLDERSEAVLTELRRSVTYRLAIANPKHATAKTS